MTKTCFKCSTTLPIEQFYRHPMMADGYLNKCKRCARVDVRKNRLEKRDQYNKYDSARYKLVHRWPTPDQLKHRARVTVHNHVKRGTLRKPDHCSKCGSSERIEAHHEDYSKPLKVIGLCRLCHADVHATEKLRA
jgi:hypothetical protein